MNHIRLLLNAILIYESKAETLWEIEVELNSRKLPFPSNGILNLKIDLRTIERTTSLIDIILEPFFFNRLLKSLRSRIPFLLRTDRLLRLGRDIGMNLIKTEGMKHMKRETKNLHYLIIHLLWCYNQVGIILSESPYPHQAM